MFNFFRKKKGCTDGMNQQEKEKFFQSLSDFATTDEQFFKEQYCDLQPQEQTEFVEWISIKTEQQKTMLQMIAIIEKLLVLKHQ